MSGSAGLILISNGAATGAQQQWPGGIAVFSVIGTFAGATVNLQMVGPDGSTLITAGTNTTLTAAGAGVAYLPPCTVQATVTGGPPSGIYATLARVVG